MSLLLERWRGVSLESSVRSIYISLRVINCCFSSASLLIAKRVYLCKSYFVLSASECFAIFKVLLTFSPVLWLCYLRFETDGNAPTRFWEMPNGFCVCV